MIHSGKSTYVDIETATESKRRRAASGEANEYPDQTSHSPMAFQMAFQAHHGLLPWEAWMDPLIPSWERSEQRAFGK